MTITYPLSLPDLAFFRFELEQENAVALGESPFTGEQQVQAHQLQRWRANITLPPMVRAAADPWRAVLAQLRGPYGTFLLGDPNGGTARGIATGSPVARSRQNWLTYSEDFSNAAWVITGTGSVTANAAVAPDGTTTADLLDDTSAVGNQSKWVQAVTIPSTNGRVWYARIAIKKVSVPATSVVTIILYGGGTPVTTYGQITWSATPTINTGTIEALGNDWYLVTLTATNNATGNVSAALEVYPGGFTTDLAQVYVWGAQIRPDAPGEYLATTTTAVTTAEAQASGRQYLYTGGWTASQSGILKAGDYLQLGSGSTSRLYMVTADADSDAQGLATLDIWPSIREAPADGATITVSNPKGLFRLSRDIGPVSMDPSGFYGMGFEAVEAL